MSFIRYVLLGLYAAVLWYSYGAYDSLRNRFTTQKPKRGQRQRNNAHRPTTPTRGVSDARS